MSYADIAQVEDVLKRAITETAAAKPTSAKPSDKELEDYAITMVREAQKVVLATVKAGGMTSIGEVLTAMDLDRNIRDFSAMTPSGALTIYIDRIKAVDRRASQAGRPLDYAEAVDEAIGSAPNRTLTFEHELAAKARQAVALTGRFGRRG